MDFIKSNKTIFGILLILITTISYVYFNNKRILQTETFQIESYLAENPEIVETGGGYYI
jgi:hypothetical protein